VSWYAHGGETTNNSATKPTKRGGAGPQSTGHNPESVRGLPGEDRRGAEAQSGTHDTRMPEALACPPGSHLLTREQHARERIANTTPTMTNSRRALPVSPLPRDRQDRAHEGVSGRPIPCADGQACTAEPMRTIADSNRHQPDAKTRSWDDRAR